MENMPSFSLFACSSLILFAILYPNLGCLAARKLLEEEAPSPGNNVTYESETRNGLHGGITYVNGDPRSQSGSVSNNGEPVMIANNHTGSQEGNIKNPNGSPRVQASNTSSGGQSGTIYGSDGKPQLEAHKYENGTSGVTIYGSDGKPMYHFDYQTPPGSDNNNGGSFYVPLVAP